jgi:aryl-alcohol dehydrogenase-like predicted oxidoreductase
MAQAQSMSIMPYFILANGFLGRHRSIKSFNPSDIRARRAAQHGGRQGTAVLRELEDIAMSHGADVSTIAAAWVLARPGVGIPAIGVESLEELDALMNVPFVELTRHEIALLDKVSAEHTRQWIPGRKQS